MRRLLLASLIVATASASPLMPWVKYGKGPTLPGISGDVTSGLISRWKLNDGSGTTAVDDIGSHTATLVNTPTWITGPNSNGALQFNGTTQAASAAVNLSGVTTQLTVSFWLYGNVAGVGSGAQAFEYTSDFGGGDGFYIRWDSTFSGTPEFAQSNLAAGANKAYMNPAPSAAAWHFYVVIFDRTVTAGNIGETVYVDGALKTLTSIQTDAMNSEGFANSSLYWMSRNTASFFLAGRLDDVRLYNRALTSGEVTTLYTNGAQ